jgi:hypothetical protein
VSSTDVDPPADAVAVAGRYLRVERPVTVATGLLVGLAGAAAVLTLSLGPALAVVAGLVVGVRLPVVRTGGETVLRTDADPGTVRADFAGPTPPSLALHWGVADGVVRTDDGARYEVSYLLGLRSQTLTVEPRETPGGLELAVRADGDPWATYTVDVEAADGGSRVRVAWRADRRFGLRRLPQWLVARRYRDAALVAQGYEPVSRDGRLSR